MSSDNPIDLNADVGEGFPWDRDLILGGITSANIACGAHAGGEREMNDACGWAAEAKVRIGAHPGFADRAGFGRIAQPLDPAQVTALILPQWRRLHAVAARHGLALHHIKAHGALYHQLDIDPDLAAAFADVVRSLHGPGVSAPVVFGPPDGTLRNACLAAGLTFWPEGFPDRAYGPDGRLLPRTDPGACLDDPAEIAAQAVRLARSGRFKTLCLHGDHPECPARLTQIQTLLAPP